jgi:hypothetical protein
MNTATRDAQSGLTEDAEWTGSPCPHDPDNFWIDDKTGERVNAHTGERTPNIDWYERRDELNCDDVFTSANGLVKLDRRVPGDGTKWYAADWWNGSWAYMDSTIEPGDLIDRASDPSEGAA